MYMYIYGYGYGCGYHLVLDQGHWDGTRILRNKGTEYSRVVSPAYVWHGGRIPDLFFRAREDGGFIGFLVPMWERAAWLVLGGRIDWGYWA